MNGCQRDQDKRQVEEGPIQVHEASGQGASDSQEEGERGCQT